MNPLGRVSVSPGGGLFVSPGLCVNAALSRAGRRSLPQVRVGSARDATAPDDAAAVCAAAGPAAELCVGALGQGAVGAPPKVGIGTVPRDVVRPAKEKEMETPSTSRSIRAISS